MRKIVTLSSVSSVGLLLLPALANAQTLGGVIGLISDVLNALIGILIALAIVVFFWGLVQYLVNVGEEKGQGLQIMFYGVIAIFVMVSIWGIIRLLQTTFRVGDVNSVIPAPIRPHQIR